MSAHAWAGLAVGCGLSLALALAWVVARTLEARAVARVRLDVGRRVGAARVALAWGEPSVAMPDTVATSRGGGGLARGPEWWESIDLGAPPVAGPPVAPPRTTEDQAAERPNGRGLLGGGALGAGPEPARIVTTQPRERTGAPSASDRTRVVGGA